PDVPQRNGERRGARLYRGDPLRSSGECAGAGRRFRGPARRLRGFAPPQAKLNAPALAAQGRSRGEPGRIRYFPNAADAAAGKAPDRLLMPNRPDTPSFQRIILELQQYWDSQG